MSVLCIGRDQYHYTNENCLYFSFPSTLSITAAIFSWNKIPLLQDELDKSHVSSAKFTFTPGFTSTGSVLVSCSHICLSALSTEQ